MVAIVDLTVALRQLDAAIDKAANPETEPPKPTAREILLREHLKRQGEA